MKNYILLTFALLITINSIAQEEYFFKDKWKILELKSSFKGSETILYHRDSNDNVIDYSKYEIKFLQDGSYNGVNKNGSVYKGTWFFSLDKDSASIDGSRYRIMLINSNYFTTRAFTLQLADTLGTLDTAYSDFTMYSVPDVVTSLYETALGNENVKVFPNPTKGMIEIKGTDNLNDNISNVRLTNTLGQVVRSCNATKTTSLLSIDMAELHNGVYTLEVINTEGKRIAIKKVIKE